MIQAGKTVYLGHVQVLADGTGATTLQPLDLSNWVPANATRMFFEVKYYRAEADQWGNMDSFASIRIPSAQNQNIASIGVAGKGYPPYSQLEVGGIKFDTPNDPADPRKIYWVNQGAALNNTCWALYLTGYELP